MMKRRNFLQTGLAMGAAPVGWLSALAQISEAQASSDYKAVLAIQLLGGNDSYNTLVPVHDSDYNEYFRLRSGGSTDTDRYQGLALHRLALNSTLLVPSLGNSGLAPGHAYALHPNMPELSKLFNDGHSAWVMNVGSLKQPLTKAQYAMGGDRLPPKLFSHNDQQAWVLTADNASGSKAGFGALLAQNFSKESLSLVSVTGNNRFVRGPGISPTFMTSIGPVIANSLQTSPGPLGMNALSSQDYRTLVSSTDPHPLRRYYSDLTKQNLSMYDNLSSKLSSTESLQSFFPSRSTNLLTGQLLLAARFITSHESFGVSRQVITASLGGFDTHANQIQTHDSRLRSVSQAIGEFYNAMGHYDLDKKVLIFIISDFGRTLVVNGAGTDHGWGGHYCVVGGGIQGGRFFGKPPSIGLGHSQDVGNGRLLPTTSWAEMVAMLGRWMGVPDAQIPNLHPFMHQFNWADSDLMEMLPT